MLWQLKAQMLRMGKGKGRDMAGMWDSFELWIKLPNFFIILSLFLSLSLHVFHSLNYTPSRSALLHILWGNKRKVAGAGIVLRWHCTCGSRSESSSRSEICGRVEITRMGGADVGVSRLISGED